MRVVTTFTASEVRALVGVTQRELSHWATTGVVEPHGRPAHGRGSRRLYTVVDVIQCKIVYRLRAASVPLQRVRKALAYLQAMEDDPAPLAELEVFSDGKRIFIRRSDDRVMDILAHQYVLWFSVADLIAEINETVGVAAATSDRAVREKSAIPVVGASHAAY